jgi:hypothetical protein
VFQPLQVLSNTYYERMEPIQSSIVRPISSEYLPLARTIYGWKYESSPIVEKKIAVASQPQDPKSVPTFIGSI